MKKLIFFALLLFHTAVDGDVDPCHREDFCARIVIIINGAGARLLSQVPSEAIDANAAIKMFIEDSPVLAPSIVFSSDSAVRNTKRMSELEKTGTVTVLPATLSSFRNAISKEGRLGAIRSQLLRSKQFVAMVKPGEDISKYVKIEIIVLSHSVRETISGGKYTGLPIWASDDRVGSHFPNDPVLTKKDFQPLYDVFPNSVVQAFICSCDSANVGEMIAPDPALSPAAALSGCYCFAGMVGKDLVAPVRLDSKTKSAEDDAISLFASHLQINSVNGRWRGASNLQELNLSLFDYFRTNAREPDEQSIVDSMFRVNPKSANPFEDFAVNSLDNLVASGNKKRPPEASGLQKEANINYSELETLSKEVNALLAKQRTAKNGLIVMASKYVRGHERLQDSFFKTRNNTRDYIKNCYYDVNQLGCQTIYGLVQSARVAGNDSLDVTFKKLEEGIAAFADEEAYTFGRPGSGFIPLNTSERKRLFGALDDVRANWGVFNDLKRLLNEEAEKQEKSGALNGELQNFNGYISTFHQSFLHAYFPDLVEDALHKRAEALTNYVNGALKDGRIEDLRNVRNQIDCLTDIPVGPAFDRKYILPKLPETQPRVVDVSEPRPSKEKSPQVYLLAPDGVTAGRAR